MNQDNINSKDNRSFFQFSNPVLKESMFSINSKFNHKKNVNQEQLKIETAANQPKLNSKTDFFVSTVAVRVSNVSPNEMRHDVTHPFFINVVMQSTFRWNKSSHLNENMVKKLLSVNAPSMLLGYIRPYITDLTSKTEFPTQYIPFIDFTRKNKN